MANLEALGWFSLSHNYGECSLLEYNILILLCWHYMLDVLATYSYNYVGIIS